MSAKSTTVKKSMPFSEAIAELEALVKTLEHGELELEDSLQHFERGVALARHCRGSLSAAEQRIDVLSDDALTDSPTLKPYTPPTD